VVTTASGLLLVAGFVAFAVGGLLPPAKAYTGTPDEQLEVVGKHTKRWIASAFAIATGVVLTLTGLGALSVALTRHGSAVLPVVAVATFGVGAVLFLAELAFRATIMVAVASSPDTVPSWFAPLRAWAGAMYWGYMVLAYVGVASVGGAILQAPSVLGAGFGWAAVGFGLLGIVVYLARFPRGLWALLDIPGLLYILTGTIGAGLLMAG
jgi:hypothetical protein